MLFDLLFPFPTRIRLFIYYSRERYLFCKTVFLLTRSMWKDLFSTMVGLAINNSGLFFLRLTDKLFSFCVTKCYDEIQDNSSTSNISPENIKLYSARRFLFCVFSTWNNEFYQQQKENGLILLHILHVTLSKIKYREECDSDCCFWKKQEFSLFEWSHGIATFVYIRKTRLARMLFSNLIEAILRGFRMEMKANIEVISISASWGHFLTYSNNLVYLKL